jgi:hypothetical protein
MGGDDVPPGDPGIVEYAGQPIEQAFPPGPSFASKFLGRGLFDHVWRNRGGKRE